MASQVYDICLASDWCWDREFFSLMEQSARERGITTYIVWPENLEETIFRLQAGDLHFRYLFDRAGSTPAPFNRLYAVLRNRHTRFLDSSERMAWASDKATMHHELLACGIKIPYTIILEPYSVTQDVRISEEAWSRLDRPFVIKPASTTGGGTGVIRNAKTLEEIAAARREFPDERYLIQKLVCPLESEQKRFWFRVFHVFGSLFFTWWHDQTHLYEVLTDEMLSRYKLDDMIRITQCIADICGLNFFSTEIALNLDNQLLVVDYVNEACDLRMQPDFADGIPAHIASGIAQKILESVRRQLRSSDQGEANGSG